jgi:hypothetical protein
MATTQTAEAEQEVVYQISVPIPKASRSWDVDYSKLPRHIYEAALRKGLADLMGRGLSKIAVKDEDGEKLEGEALEKANQAASSMVEKNLEAMYSGEMSVRGGTKRKITGAIKTRAKQKALRIVKAQIKAENERIGDYSSKELSLAAEQMLEDFPAIIEEAREEIEKEEKEIKEKGYIKVESNGKSKLVQSLKKDPKRVAANEARKVKNPKPKGRQKGETTHVRA